MVTNHTPVIFCTTNWARPCHFEGNKRAKLSSSVYLLRIFNLLCGILRDHLKTFFFIELLILFREAVNCMSSGSMIIIEIFLFLLISYCRLLFTRFVQVG